ncbi:MAG: shikimate kinase [Muribaculaceae bacterium]|nr:shikimate kinase [Muribaculaceae bacterium]
MIFLIGFMGAGKTTLGRALEARLPGWRYIDLDQEIEKTAGISVSRFFALHGEEAFRQLERVTLTRVTHVDGDLIIGCGGGTPCYYDNMTLMNNRGLTILLEASHPTLLRRLLEAQARRPKLAGLSPDEVSSYIRQAIDERTPYYSRAAHTFATDRLENIDEIHETCARFIDRFISPADKSPDLISPAQS